MTKPPFWKSLSLSSLLQQNNQQNNKPKAKQRSQTNTIFQAACLAFWKLWRPTSSFSCSQQETSSEAFQFPLSLCT